MGKRKYTEEQIDFVRECYFKKLMSARKTVFAFNKKFNTDIDMTKLKTILRRHKIKRQNSHRFAFTDDVIKRIQELEPDHTDKEIARILNEEYSYHFTRASVGSARNVYDWKRAVYHRTNNSIKGKNTFSPDGAIRLDRSDLMIKYGNDFVSLRRVLYEYYNNVKLEKNQYVFHKNGNKFDFSKENLCMLPYKEFTKKVNKVLKYKEPKIVDSVIAIQNAELSIDNLKEQDNEQKILGMENNKN